MSDLETIMDEAFEAFDRGDSERALTLYQTAMDDYSPDPDTLHHIRYMMAFTHAEAGAHDTARSIYQTLLSQADDAVKRHRVLHQLAMVERMVDNFGTARNYLEKEQAILDELPDDRPMERAANLYEQGVLHYLEDQQKQAKQLLKRALKASKQSGDPVSRACALRGLGDTYAATDQTCAAENYYRRSMDYFQQAGDSYGFADTKKRLEKLIADNEKET
jgi:tetratricopeptide (TPR) repeat protein